MLFHELVKGAKEKEEGYPKGSDQRCPVPVTEKEIRKSRDAQRKK